KPPAPRSKSNNPLKGSTKTAARPVLRGGFFVAASKSPYSQAFLRGNNGSPAGNFYIPPQPAHFMKLTVNEIYLSIQGESTWAGLPCVFVRLTFCDLRCTYCDTEYAFYEGHKRTLDEVYEEVMAFDVPLVELTGGEPLLQKASLPL